MKYILNVYVKDSVKIEDINDLTKELKNICLNIKNKIQFFNLPNINEYKAGFINSYIEYKFETRDIKKIEEKLNKPFIKKYEIVKELKLKQKKDLLISNIEYNNLFEKITNKSLLKEYFDLQFIKYQEFVLTLKNRTKKIHNLSLEIELKNNHEIYFERSNYLKLIKYIDNFIHKYCKIKDLINLLISVKQIENIIYLKIIDSSNNSRIIDIKEEFNAKQQLHFGYTLSLEINQENYHQLSYVMKVNNLLVAIDVEYVKQIFTLNYGNIHKIDKYKYYNHDNKQYITIDVDRIMSGKKSKNIKEYEALLVEYNSEYRILLFNKYISTSLLFIQNKKVINLDNVQILDIDRILK